MQDCNVYPDLHIIRDGYRMTEGLWTPFEKDGLQVKTYPGQYGEMVELWIDGFNWMNLAPIDFLDHSCILKFKGRMVSAGGGLFLACLFAEKNPDIVSNIVIERDSRVIEYLWPIVQPHVPKTTLIQGDADEIEVPEHDVSYLDHAKELVSRETVARFTNPVVWFEEHNKWR